jgi:hypothetical protein
VFSPLGELLEASSFARVMALKVLRDGSGVEGSAFGCSASGAGGCLSLRTKFREQYCVTGFSWAERGRFGSAGSGLDVWMGVGSQDFGNF